jgi:hypothetical protein
MANLVIPLNVPGHGRVDIAAQGVRVHRLPGTSLDSGVYFHFAGYNFELTIEQARSTHRAPRECIV